MSLQEAISYYSFDGFVFAINALNTQYVIAEIQRLEFTLLIQKHYHGATCPVQSLTKQFPKW